MSKAIEKSSKMSRSLAILPDAAQGPGILLGFLRDSNQGEHAVFGIPDAKEGLITVIRGGIREDEELVWACYFNLNKRIELDCVTLELHLECLKHNVGALVEYCRICLGSIVRNEPLSTSEAVEQAKKVML